MNTLILNQKRISIALLIVVAFAILIPSVAILADEMGGFRSELLAGQGTGSEKFIGSSLTPGSFLDIGFGWLEEPTQYIPPTSGEYQLNIIIPIIFMGLFIIMIVAFMASGEIGFTGLIIVAVAIFMFYGFLADIQKMISALIGG